MYFIYIDSAMTSYFLLALLRLCRGVFSASMMDFALLVPLQLPLMVPHVEFIIRKACAFFKHWLALGFSLVPPRCLC